MKDQELEKQNCECEECHCGENCNCTEECHCHEHECECGDDCDCTEEHNCGCLDNNCDERHECHCECEEDDDDYKKDKKNKKEKKDKIKKLENKIDELKKELKESEDKALLSKAEMVNYRKRKDEEIMRMLKYANEDIIKELLPVVVNFERAIKLDDNNLDDELSKFLEGFKMIYCNLVSILEKSEVKQIDGINKPFDPTYHQAVMTEASDKEKDMVIEVLQKGYLYKDKVIRPAMVKVSE